MMCGNLTIVPRISWKEPAGRSSASLAGMCYLDEERSRKSHRNRMESLSWAIHYCNREAPRPLVSNQMTNYTIGSNSTDKERHSESERTQGKGKNVELTDGVQREELLQKLLK